ncbi:MAG: DUF2141 domain-containing protein [Lysobacterales bacterium]
MKSLTGNFGVFLLVWTGIVQAASVTIEIEGLASEQGTLYAGLCTEQGWENFQCENVKLTPSTAILTHQWKDVAAGEYGVTLLHDKNDNGKMDFGFFGGPTEQWGSSNNPPPRMGRSLWKDVRFELDQEAQTLRIRMQPGS